MSSLLMDQCVSQGIHLNFRPPALSAGFSHVSFVYAQALFTSVEAFLARDVCVQIPCLNKQQSLAENKGMEVQG